MTGRARFRLGSRGILWLTVLAALMIALRLLTILTAVEQTYFVEELYRGTIAKELIDGLKMRLFDYMPDSHSGASLAIGFVTTPFFMLLGPSLFALKSATLLFSLGAFVALFVFLNRFFSRRAAIYGSLLFILSPPGITTLSLQAVLHSQSPVFAILALLFFYHTMFDDDRSHDAWPPVLFGLASGIGVSFTYLTSEFPLACLACWAIAEPGFIAGARFRFFLVGLAAGLVPWLAFNATHHFDGLWYVIAGFDHSIPDFPKPSIGPLLAKLGRLVFITSPQSLLFEGAGRVTGAVLSRLYLGLVYVAALALAVTWIRRRRSDAARLGPLLVYPAVFFLIFTVSHYFPMGGTPYDFRYFSLLHIWMILVLAVAADSMPLGRVLLTVTLALGLYGQAGLMWREPFGQALRYKGYSYYLLGQMFIEPGMARDRASEVASWTDRYAPEDRRYFYYSFLSALPVQHGHTPIQQFHQEVGVRSREYWPFLFEWLPNKLGCDPAGLTAVEHAGGDAARPYYFRVLFEQQSCVSTFGEAPGALPEDAAPFFYAGIGAQWFSGALPRNDAWFTRYAARDREVTQAVVRRAPEAVMPWLYEGVGRAAGSEWITGGGSFDEVRRQVSIVVPSQYESAFMNGAGWSIRNANIEDPVWARAWIDRLPAESRADALAGAEKWRQWYGFSR